MKGVKPHVLTTCIMIMTVDKKSEMKQVRRRFPNWLRGIIVKVEPQKKF